VLFSVAVGFDVERKVVNVLILQELNMSKTIQVCTGQEQRNNALLQNCRVMKNEVESKVLPFSIDIANTKELSQQQIDQWTALTTEAARIALSSLASLATIGELDHLGGGLDLLPALMMTLGATDYENVHYTIEHAHTSVGYYSVLAALGFLDKDLVVDGFRRGLDVPGHVSWVPGGTELNGGRLGIMIPAAVGQALGMKAKKGGDALVFCHIGDAGWISGQALNGFNGAHLHQAPISFVMHRNGIQLSGSNKSIMDKDPRPIISSLGITIIETPTLHDPVGIYAAYREASSLAKQGKPSMIYPTGYKSDGSTKVDLNVLGEKYGITKEVEAFAAKNGVEMGTEIWIPGALMSYRDIGPMLECVFLVNDLPGGAGHHDGHMKNRDLSEVLSNPMLQDTPASKAAMDALTSQAKRTVTTTARPAVGSENLVLSADALADVELPPAGAMKSPRAGSEAGYATVAKAFPESVFVVSCDLDPSTKLGKARKFLADDHQFEMSIEEQVSALMANGLAVSSREPQMNVVSTFAAFYEGIAREGFEMWRYTRNLTGVNEGLNAVMHLSHVGSCTGRDHFSGWSLNWINMGLEYLPYLHRFYAPADARAAFLAVKDCAANYGGHMVCIPRDNLPVLEKQDGSGALWEAGDEWTPVTEFRTQPGAKKAILAMGAPAFLAAEAADALSGEGTPVDVHIINGLPLGGGELASLIERYPEGIATIEDGLIGAPGSALVGFAGMVATVAAGGTPTAHVGITDPRVAPAEGHMETWEHFGITVSALIEAVKGL
jgi:transketolase